MNSIRVVTSDSTFNNINNRIEDIMKNESIYLLFPENSNNLQNEINTVKTFLKKNLKNCDGIEIYIITHSIITIKIIDIMRDVYEYCVHLEVCKYEEREYRKYNEYLKELEEKYRGYISL